MDCPTCGKSLNTEQGMRQHHTKVHDEALPNRTCKRCGEAFYDQKARRTYCEDCYTERGRQNSNWTGAKERANCERCGAEFEYYPSNKDGVYCSECVKNAEEFLGTPSYEDIEAPRTEQECEKCGQAFTVLESTLQREPCRFCSQFCLYEWMSEDLYEGDSSKRKYRGEWWSVRRAARERDNNTCKICGKDENDIGRNLDVHHIIPVRKFENPQDAHELGNVITLCPKCHRNVELGNLNCPKPE